jgi:hypothetical protein
MTRASRPSRSSSGRLKKLIWTILLCYISLIMTPGLGLATRLAIGKLKLAYQFPGICRL